VVLLGLLPRPVGLLFFCAFLSYAPMSLVGPLTVAVAAFLISLVFAHGAEVSVATAPARSLSITETVCR
jgi:hypothetical protein